jgi:uncharacterized protein (DUF302 family)
MWAAIWCPSPRLMEPDLKTLPRLAAALALVLLASFAGAAEGLVDIKSTYSATETMSRLADAVAQRGLTVFARIDHAAGALKVGKTLRPTEVLIFGNPQGGTSLMECAQTIGIDLPLKALVWEDDTGQVWLAYNDPAFLARRHGAAQCPAVEGLRKALAGLAEAAVARPAQTGAAPIGYRSVAEALAALEARDGNGTIVTRSEGWAVVNEPLAAAQWSFTPPGHTAYPAVVRRTVRRSADGAVSVETASLCEASPDACAKLLVEFAGLNDRISQAIRAKGRQGAPRP